MSIDEAQPCPSLLGNQRIDQLGNGFFYAKGGLGTAQLGADPPWRHEHQSAPVASAASGIAAHILIQCSLAASIDFVAARLVVGDAALDRKSVV